MKYSDLSDFEINKLVADIVDFGDMVVSIRGCNKTIYLLEKESGESDLFLPSAYFDPCLDSRDAWPIIVENEIAVIPPVSNGTNEWKAERFYNENCGKLIDCIDKNPLRAAMIVFLMMNEKSPD